MVRRGGGPWGARGSVGIIAGTVAPAMCMGLRASGVGNVHDRKDKIVGVVAEGEYRRRDRVQGRAKRA